MKHIKSITEILQIYLYEVVTTHEACPDRNIGSVGSLPANLYAFVLMAEPRRKQHRDTENNLLRKFKGSSNSSLPAVASAKAGLGTNRLSRQTSLSRLSACLPLAWHLAGPSWQGTFRKSHEPNNLCEGQLVPSSVAGQGASSF